MRKLRNAALVAAMLGSFSMLGAGVAAAGDGDGYGHPDGRHHGKDGNVVVCEQRSNVSQDTFQLGLINVATGPVTVLGSGPATAVAVQQICSGEDTLARNDADAETGPGVDIDLDLL
ncbi:hypothetical protein J7E96_36555 [Streptomyces sp. ISL-96]|uniref:hypothetical protein n=1 Tax=Streptomyces sp. ISL-96 TaxID=2819191 RepID=UPI001BE6DBEB|nr:hypothetical protein [Streptomyces sp. ISL-96]MBT2493908.1 hypothetical protein [Streptomyces sp. ISL-96]